MCWPLLGVERKVLEPTYFNSGDNQSQLRGHVSCASHRTPHSERLPAWFNALQSPFEILNTFLTKGLVLSFCSWPYKLCSQPWRKFPLYPTNRVKMCPTFALDNHGSCPFSVVVIPRHPPFTPRNVLIWIIILIINTYIFAEQNLKAGCD